MDTIQSKITNLVGHVEDYLKTREELAKLVAAEKAGTVAGTLFSSIVLLLIFSIVFLFLSFSVAYYVGELLGKVYLGFITVTGFYLLAGLLLYANRERWLKMPIMNVLIRNFFKGESHEEN